MQINKPRNTSDLENSAFDTMALSEHCTLSATLRRFSSFSVSTEYHCDSDRFKRHFKATFYANGSCTENEGHVSIIFNGIHQNYLLYYHPSKFSCTAFVVDAAGNKRFPQSFVLCDDIRPNGGNFLFKRDFGFEKYIKRSTLLNDSSELLPGDSLNLCLEIHYEVSKLLKYSRHGFNLGNDGCYLDTSTEFVRDLCKMSRVFQRMMESPMAEKVTGCISVPPEEYKCFMLIFAFLSERDFNGTLSDVCDLYVLADKYDMQQIIQLCHQLLMSLLHTINTQEILNYINKYIHLISELADRFVDDESLRDILAIYSDIKNKYKARTGDLKTFKPRYELDAEWRCEYKEENNSSSFFVFRKNKIEHLKLDVYK